MKTYNGLRCLFVVLFFALAFSASYARQSMTGWKKEATVSLSVSTVNDPAHPGKNTTWVLTISGSPTVANGGAVSFVVYKIKDENGNTVHTQVGSVPSFNATVLGNGGSDTQYTSEPGGCLPDPGQYEID